jgi:hypothetical protein
MATDDLTSRHGRGPAVRRTIALAVAVALAAPAVADAADLTADGACFAGRQTMTLSGTSFSPVAPVAIAGDVTGSAQADASGAFTAQVAAPAIAELGPRTVTVTAVDRTNPANTATLHVRVVREAFGSNLPLAGRPRDRTTWRFAGFARGQPIYAHFLLDGRPRGDYRFGVAQGECGTLTVRAERVPGVRRLAPGRWTLRLDQRATYHQSGPGRTYTFGIRRRSSRGPGSGGGDGGPGPD